MENNKIEEVPDVTEQEQGQIMNNEEEQEQDINEQAHNGLVNMIKNELVKTINSLINEIDLVFDYVDKSVVKKLQEFVKNLPIDNNMQNFTDVTLPIIKKYESQISLIVTSKQKIKTADFEFLNQIVLFDDILPFSVFNDENKNTKKTIVNYIYNIYMSLFILQFGSTRDESNDNFTNELSNFITTLQTQIQPKAEVKIKQKRQQRPLQNSNSGLEGIFESLLSNGEIMNIATDLSNDIQMQNIDPMTLLSSVMSGKPNKQLQKLVSNITGKIERKINNGEIDKNMLEQQAKSIIDTVQNSGDIQSMLNSQMPQINNILNGMSKK
jgi:hypothetical protein